MCACERERDREKEWYLHFNAEVTLLLQSTVRTVSMVTPSHEQTWTVNEFLIDINTTLLLSVLLVMVVMTGRELVVLLVEELEGGGGGGGMIIWSIWSDKLTNS